MDKQNLLNPNPSPFVEDGSLLSISKGGKVVGREFRYWELTIWAFYGEN